MLIPLAIAAAELITSPKFAMDTSRLTHPRDAAGL
jgi:hypothetical protein